MPGTALKFFTWINSFSPHHSLIRCVLRGNRDRKRVTTLQKIYIYIILYKYIYYIKYNIYTLQNIYIYIFVVIEDIFLTTALWSGEDVRRTGFESWL